MKSWRFYVILFFFVVLNSFSINAEAENYDDTFDSTFLLPDSLKIVEDEAFSGTAVETVIFPEGILQIHDKAFEGAWALSDVYIPDTTNYIADSAFPITSNLTIHGINGSYAEDWASRHRIPFVDDNAWHAIVQGLKIHISRSDPNIWNVTILVLILFFAYFRLGYCRSGRPQDRPELYPIDYRFP